MSGQPSAGEPLLEGMQRAIARLDDVMREEGVHPHTPLGLWTRAVGEAMGAFASVAASTAMEVRQAREDVARLTALARQQTEESQRQLQEACKQVAILKSTSETRLRLQDKVTEQDRQSAIHRFVSEMARELKQTLFAELKKKLPFDERRFMILDNGRRMFMAFVAAGLMVVFGYWVGLRHSSYVFQLGQLCQQDLQHDPVHNYNWCRILPGGTGSQGG